MFDKILTIFSIPELRRRILFTLGMLAVYRVGCHVPLPGVDLPPDPCASFRVS